MGTGVRIAAVCCWSLVAITSTRTYLKHGPRHRRPAAMLLELTVLACLGPVLLVLRAFGAIDLSWPRVLLFLLGSTIFAVAAKNLAVARRGVRTQQADRAADGANVN